VTPAPFDANAYYRGLADVHRERIRHLEREVSGLRARERHLLRVLILTLDLATGASHEAETSTQSAEGVRTPSGQAAALLVLRALDQAATECAQIDSLAELLHQTDPARITAARRAA
jgi:hypothetical protein